MQPKWSLLTGSEIEVIKRCSSSILALWNGSAGVIVSSQGEYHRNYVHWLIKLYLYVDVLNQRIWPIVYHVTIKP